MTTLTTTQKQTLQSMNGEELFYNGLCVGIDYPMIWEDGEHKKLTASQWIDLYNEYLNSPSNEGYHLIQQARSEFI